MHVVVSSKPHMADRLTESSCTAIQLTIRLHVFPVTARVMLPVLSRNTADAVHDLLIQSVQPWLQTAKTTRGPQIDRIPHRAFAISHAEYLYKLTWLLN